MLTQLLNAGKLQECAGILFGEMIDCDPPKEALEYPMGSFHWEEVLSERLGSLGIPVMAGLCFDHGRHKATLPLGDNGPDGYPSPEPFLYGSCGELILKAYESQHWDGHSSFNDFRLDQRDFQAPLRGLGSLAVLYIRRTTNLSACPDFPLSDTDRTTIPPRLFFHPANGIP